MSGGGTDAATTPADLAAGNFPALPRPEASMDGEGGHAATTFARTAAADPPALHEASMSCEDEAAAAAIDDLPPLLPELWGAIARATAKAEGCTLAALARLSLVSVAWRDGLRGER